MKRKEFADLQEKFIYTERQKEVMKPLGMYALGAVLYGLSVATGGWVSTLLVCLMACVVFLALALAYTLGYDDCEYEMKAVIKDREFIEWHN